MSDQANGTGESKSERDLLDRNIKEALSRRSAEFCSNPLELLRELDLSLANIQSGSIHAASSHE